MERIKISARNNWQSAVENLGFGFHSTDVPYWDESVYYKFSEREINKIEKATGELWDMCLNAVQYVIDKKLYAKFHIPEWIIPDLEKSWDNDLPSIYGRLDLAYKNGEIKLLEFNADTPTSLYEAGIVQWFWLQDFDKEKDQFNSIHEKLIAYWSELKKHLHQGKLHFTCIKDSLEDLTTVEYLRDCAIQAGIETKLVFIDDIGWDFNGQFFVDADDEQIRNIFKLYPYEWLLNEDFGRNLTVDLTDTLWIEPLWKMILSNKAILPFLWEIYPHHPYLLKTYFDKGDLIDYAKKPILSREGSNIELFKNGRSLEKTSGEYGEEGFIYQDLFELPDFDGNYPLIGSWIIGQMPAGIGVREANRLITDNKSRFVPHLIG
ncbi:MAG: glutathionylspermidine synthase family protein [Flavobacterium sp.]|nr:MAG: glutathionylspermidine synthase family protein [Flavobacterium sp.]